MEATASASASAPHLLHCGGFGRTRVAGLVSPLPRRRRLRRVLAVATEPRPPPPASRPRANAITSTRFGDVSKEIKRVRKQMEEDEQLASLMRGLRGSNLRDDQFADKDVTMRLVEVTNTEGLPLVYSPEIISAYWGKRPGAVATRAVQLLSVAGGFISGIISDLISDKIKENEVARAIELREIVTSLGPAYIKLGQALSIRPDILSPAAMTELQKLCDKVPSFPDDVAMALLEEELGKPWQEIYSELSPSPIAAASLGQVYKGRLKETGELVAVKVQRPFAGWWGGPRLLSPPPPWVFSGELCATAAVDGMDAQAPWRAGPVGSRLSYKNATLALCAINVLAVALLLRNHFSAWPRLAGSHRFDSAQLRYIWESEELRRAMEPVDLIKRVKEIEQESYGEHGMSTQEDPKQTAAVDLSKRLKDLRQGNDGSSQRAVVEWRKRKMERARQRAIDKDAMMPGAKAR